MFRISQACWILTVMEGQTFLPFGGILIIVKIHKKIFSETKAIA